MRPADIGWIHHSIRLSDAYQANNLCLINLPEIEFDDCYSCCHTDEVAKYLLENWKGMCCVVATGFCFLAKLNNS